MGGLVDDDGHALALALAVEGDEADVGVLVLWHSPTSRSTSATPAQPNMGSFHSVQYLDGTGAMAISQMV